MPMTWNSDADAKLFVAVLKTTAVKLDYNALAAEMGQGCTAKAITHRISNMKKAAGGGATAAAASNGDGAPSTPKSRKTASSITKSPKTPTAKTPKSAAGSKRKAKSVAPEPDLGAVEDDEGLELKSEDDDGGSPTKKLKADPEEEDDEDELYMG